MKKWIVLAVVLVLVLGGSVATIIGLKGNNSEDTSASTEASTEEQVVVPYILAQEKLVLTEDGSANTNANVFDAENATIQYKSSDINIAKVDSFGNVFATGKGSTFVQNFCILNNVEYSYNTTIIVLPKDLTLDISLFDEDDKQATNVEQGEKYTLKLATTIDLNYYEISLVASNGVKTTGIHERTDDAFSCEIYFETQDEHTISLKLTLNADCGEKTYLSNTLTFDNTEKVEEQPKEEDTTQENPTENESEDVNDDQTTQTEEETDTKTPTQDTGNNQSEDESNQEEASQVPQTPTNDDDKSDEQEKIGENEEESENSERGKADEDEEDNSSTPTQTLQQEKPQAFSLSAGTSKNVEISNSTIRISNFTEPTDIALSLKILDTTNKHKLQFEILSGDNITLELSTSMLGLSISSIGSTTFRLSSLTDPSISQTFIVVVE